jgi:hypothetical protein
MSLMMPLENNFPKETILLKMNALKSQYIRFPELPQPSLELGHCYIDPGKVYAKVLPLVIESISKV